MDDVKHEPWTLPGFDPQIAIRASRYFRGLCIGCGCKPPEVAGNPLMPHRLSHCVGCALVELPIAAREEIKQRAKTAKQRLRVAVADDAMAQQSAAPPVQTLEPFAEANAPEVAEPSLEPLPPMLLTFFGGQNEPASHNSR